MDMFTTVTIFKGRKALCWRNVKDFKAFIAFVRPFIKRSYTITRVTRII